MEQWVVRENVVSVEKEDLQDQPDHQDKLAAKEVAEELDQRELPEAGDHVVIQETRDLWAKSEPEESQVWTVELEMLETQVHQEIEEETEEMDLGATVEDMDCQDLQAQMDEEEKLANQVQMDFQEYKDHRDHLATQGYLENMAQEGHLVYKDQKEAWEKEALRDKRETKDL